jgi:GTP cyclohydrolase I
LEIAEETIPGLDIVKGIRADAAAAIPPPARVVNDAARAAAARMARALGLDKVMSHEKFEAAARNFADVMAASREGHALSLLGTASRGSPVDPVEEDSALETTEKRRDAVSGVFFERDLELATLCEHHLLPFHGAVHVAYVGEDPGVDRDVAKRFRRVSRAEAQRAVARHGRRFQVQERLTRDIARDISAITNASGVMVSVRASHLCMIARGVEKPGSTTVTSAALGVFANDAGRRARFWETLARGVL